MEVSETLRNERRWHSELYNVRENAKFVVLQSGPECTLWDLARTSVPQRNVMGQVLRCHHLLLCFFGHS